jgi:hypothetical protein
VVVRAGAKVHRRGRHGANVTERLSPRAPAEPLDAGHPKVAPEPNTVLNPPLGGQRGRNPAGVPRTDRGFLRSLRARPSPSFAMTAASVVVAMARLALAVFGLLATGLRTLRGAKHA